MSRGRAYRRHQEARARARALRTARLWHSDSTVDEVAAFVEANPAWFGVVVSTHGRPCSGGCCFGSRYRRWYPDRQSLQADLDFRDGLRESGLVDQRLDSLLLCVVRVEAVDMRDRDWDEYDDLRAEAAYERRRRTYRYNCGGFASYYGPCGASDCGSCRNGPAPWEEEEEEDREETVSRSRLVIARKARGNILPGDCVRVTTGFTYLKDGPRTGYFRYERLVGYGPGHGDKAGTGRWPKGREYVPA